MVVGRSAMVVASGVRAVRMLAPCSRAKVGVPRSVHRAVSAWKQMSSGMFTRGGVEVPAPALGCKAQRQPANTPRLLRPHGDMEE